MWNKQLLYEPTAEPVARALIAAHAYCLAPDLSAPARWFTWKSGVHAPVYTDCRVLAGDPGATALVSRALSSAIIAMYPGVEYIVGMGEAGIIWSTVVAHELGKPQAFVRKATKPHGRSGWIECSPPCGKRAVLVDDIVASGETLERAIGLLQSEKQITTLGVQSIANWNFPEMRERFFRLGIPVHALVSYPQLLDAAMDAKLLSIEAQAELHRFYKNPREHKWNLQRLRKVA